MLWGGVRKGEREGTDHAHGGLSTLRLERKAANPTWSFSFRGRGGRRKKEAPWSREKNVPRAPQARGRCYGHAAWAWRSHRVVGGLRLVCAACKTRCRKVWAKDEGGERPRDRQQLERASVDLPGCLFFVGKGEGSMSYHGHAATVRLFLILCAGAGQGWAVG